MGVGGRPQPFVCSGTVLGTDLLERDRTVPPLVPPLWTWCWFLPCPKGTVPCLGCPFSECALLARGCWQLALEGNVLHLPREEDPDHGVEHCWVHMV